MKNLILLLLLLLLLPFTGFGQISDVALTTKNDSLIRNLKSDQKRSADFNKLVIDSKANMTASYSNPSWINTLAWSKITSTPTTVAGYGITDAAITTSGQTFTGVNVFTSPQIQTSMTTSSATLTLFTANVSTVTMLSATTVFTLSGTSQGTVTATLFGNSTNSGVIKSISIGTSGLSGSITNISLGSATSGATGTLTISSTTISAKFLTINASGSFSYSQTPQSATNTFQTWTQAAHTAATPTGLLFIGGAHTGLTIVEATDINFNLARIVSFQSGSFAIQRAFIVGAPTYSSVGAVSITDAATFALSGAPIKGVNGNLTNTHALLVQAGSVGAAISSFGATINAQTGATNNYAGQAIGGSWLFAAGTTTYAPIIVPNGTNLATTKAGALENDGTHLYFTFVNSGTRYQLDQQGGGISGLTGGTVPYATSSTTIGDSDITRQTAGSYQVNANSNSTAGSFTIFNTNTGASAATQFTLITGAGTASGFTQYSAAHATFPSTLVIQPALDIRFWLSVPRKLGISTLGTAPARLLHVEFDDAVTSSVSYVQRLTHTTSGTAAIGISVGQEFEIENSSGTNKVIATIQAQATNVTSGSEAGQLDLLTTSVGVLGLAASIRAGSTSDIFGPLTVGGFLKTTNGSISITADNSATNTVSTLALLTSTSTGTPAVGIGTALMMAAETSPGVIKTGTSIESIVTNVGVATEAFDLVFKNMNAGAAAAETFRVESTGAVSMVAKKAAAPATTGTMTTTLTNLTVMTITPTGACTFNAGGGIAGQQCSFIVTTSGTTAFVLTWGTNYKTIGTLSTGTVTAKVFTVNFVYDGTNWNEQSRTVAM